MSFIPNRLDGKVAVITASTAGIGFAIAERLALEGAKVVISSRQPDNVESAVSKLKAQNFNVVGVVCDVAKAQDRAKLFQEAIEKFGAIDILVSNAAANTGYGPLFKCEESVWDTIFEVNVKSSFLLVKEALSYFRKRGGGRVVFVSSTGAYNVVAGLGPYSVSKTALVGLTKVAAKELAGENVTVNCVAPGLVKTNFSEKVFRSKAGHKLAMATIPMRRAGQPPEIAGLVALLVSDDGKYITGETVVAGGGPTSRL